MREAYRSEPGKATSADFDASEDVACTGRFGGGDAALLDPVKTRPEQDLRHAISSSAWSEMA